MRHRIRRSAAWIGWVCWLAAGAASAGDLNETIGARPGGTLHVELDAGSIEIESHDASDVEVEARAAGASSDGIRFSLEGDGIDVRLGGEMQGWLSRMFGDPRIRVRLRVPKRYSIDARTQGGSIEIERIHGSVAASSSGGRVEAEGIEGPVELRTSGGAVVASGIRGELHARTSGGPVRISDVIGDVEALTSGGAISVHEVEGQVHAETSGGAISVRWRGAPAGVLKTSGGGIEIEIPADRGVDLDARTSGGRVRIDRKVAINGRVEPQHIEAAINGGGEALSAHTSGGPIRIDLR